MHICAKGEGRCSLVCVTKLLHFFINKTQFIHTQARKNKVSFPHPALCYWFSHLMCEWN